MHDKSKEEWIILKNLTIASLKFLHSRYSKVKKIFS
ncbi:MAG: hypothetical protein RL403_944 [Bacteroidota bacterium]